MVSTIQKAYALIITTLQANKSGAESLNMIVYLRKLVIFQFQKENHD